MNGKAALPLTVVGALLFLPAPATNAASPSAKVLKLPFNDPGVSLTNGWDYSFSSKDHEGIDYKKGPYPDWVGFDVVAAYGGELKCVPNGTISYDGYGNTCTVKHTVGPLTFYTLYAHLDSYVKASGTVVTGEKIGFAGKTGTASGNIIHLHFEVQINGLCMDLLCRKDPYDLYTTRDTYPGYINTDIMGADHWWADAPPVHPGAPMNNGTCFDGVKNQDETDIDCGGICPPCNTPVCTNGDRRRCWVECIQEFPSECLHGGLPPLLFGIETCAGGAWGACDVNNSCAELANPCQDDGYLVGYECVDQTMKQGVYDCRLPLGANCTTEFYSGLWPYVDCSSICFGNTNSCDVEGQERACEVYCDSPNGPKRSGVQDCRDVSCGMLMWSPCITQDACLSP